MNRRTYLKALMAASGALVAFPAWAAEWSANDLRTNASSFTSLEQDILAAVTDAIIPAGDSPGALAVGVDVFLQKLIDDCYEKAVGDNVKAQLMVLENAAQQQSGKSFFLSDQALRQEILLKASTSDDKNARDFLELVKSETIRGFTTSKDVMLGYLHYKPIPGHFYGCVDITA